MHETHSIRDWIHQLHESGARAAHLTGHMLHQKSFWGIALFLLLCAALIALLIQAGDIHPIREYRVPMPYGQYY